jgi:hypothetical protein
MDERRSREGEMGQGEEGGEGEAVVVEFFNLPVSYLGRKASLGCA